MKSENKLAIRQRHKTSSPRKLIQHYPILDTMLEGCQIIDFDWHYIYINETAARHGHRLRHELLGRTMWEVFPGIKQTEFFQQLKQCMGERKTAAFENRFENPDGTVGWFELSIQPVPEGIFILSIDVTERHLAEEQLKKQLSRVVSLHEIDLAILSSFDLHTTLDVGLQQVQGQLQVDAANVLLLNHSTQRLSYAHGCGFKTNAAHQIQMQVGEGLAGRTAAERKVIRVPDLNSAPVFKSRMILKEENFFSYLAAPLIAKERLMGVLEIYHRSPLNPSAEWFGFLKVLTGQIAIAVNNALLFNELQHTNFELLMAYESTLEGWSAALDLRDKETEGHTQRVTTLALELAQAMNLSEEERNHIRHGALLHDIGKMGIPDHILLKPDKLTDKEWEQMKLHPVYAYNMLSNIHYLHDALDIPYCHHEKWGGDGYPRGLKGRQIPLAARIFAVVDVYDALTSNRPYRKGWPRQKTLNYIQKQAGTHFDPQVVDAFLKMMNETIVV